MNEISNREKEKNSETNNPKNKSTVKILSLNRLQIKTTIGKKGQMIFNNEENIFMIFNKCIDHLGTLLKMATVFFRISRSSCTSNNSLFNFANSASTGFPTTQKIIFYA